VVQARMIAKEALRLEAAFGKPQVMSWAFAGRLLHVLDVEPLLIPVERVESNRARTWDDRLLPTGLLSTTSPLSFSIWQKAAARGFERAGRILGVKGVILEDTRPQLPRVLGHVGGRIYANVEVLTALLDLLPFADKARAALAAVTGQAEIVPRKAPPPGFWQRQRQKLDEGRWSGQLEKIGEVAAQESERFRSEIETTLHHLGVLDVTRSDPDTLIDAFDELEDALSKAVGAIALSGLAAALYRKELEDAASDPDLAAHPGMISDLLGGEVPGDLVESTRRFFQWAELARGRAGMKRMLERHKGRFEVLADRVLNGDDLDDDERRLGEELRAFLKSMPSACTGELGVEGPRLVERPDAVLEMVARLLDTDADTETLDTLARTSNGARKKAEYLFENLKVKSSSTKKRFQSALDGARRHGRDAALLWVPCELVIAKLRAMSLVLGQRLFEHGLLDQPRDVLFLEGREIAGMIRGSSIDQDGKPLVATRKRQAQQRPNGLPRRVETRGVVATSLLSDDEDDLIITSPGEAKELSGRSVASGIVQDEGVLLDGNPLKPGEPAVPAGIVVVRSATLRDLPLLLVAKAVVAERGTTLGPAPYTLRALGVPAIVDAPQATSAFNEREPLYVDGGRGVVKRVLKLPEDRRPKKPADVVDASLFAREAVLSDPRRKVPPKTKPAPAMNEFVAPPIAKPRAGYVVPSGEITEIEAKGETSIEESDIVEETSDSELIPPARLKR
jgi:rifampicin phosphotransferase